MAASSSRKITLVSIDNVFFEVDESVALQSGTIKNMIEDVVDQNKFPLPNVDGKTLAKVVEYCKKHAESPTPSAEELKDLEAFDAQLVKVDDNHFFDLLLAANYLDIKGLLDLTCEAVADAIKDLSVEDVRKTFNIDNDFTPEEEAALMRENPWAFE